jgi:hypothetical protein
VNVTKLSNEIEYQKVITGLATRLQQPEHAHIVACIFAGQLPEWALRQFANQGILFVFRDEKRRFERG